MVDLTVAVVFMDSPYIALLQDVYNLFSRLRNWPLQKLLTSLNAKIDASMTGPIYLSIFISIDLPIYLSINLSVLCLFICIVIHLYFELSLYIVFINSFNIFIYSSLCALCTGKVSLPTFPAPEKRRRGTYQVPFASGVYWGGPQGRPCCLGLCGDPLHSTTITATITTVGNFPPHVILPVTTPM